MAIDKSVSELGGKEQQMDKTLINTKHLQLYLTTIEIGIGFTYVHQHRELIISFLLLELHISWLSE